MYARRKPQIEAQRQQQALTVATFTSWSGQSQNAKLAAKEGNRKRRKYLQDLERQARGLTKWDVVEGVDMLTTSDDVRRWMGGHGLLAG